jgi:hypothetical protein
VVRRFLLGAAMGASLLMGAAVTAGAATLPPTLAGEAFSASMEVDNATGAQFPFILGQCGNWYYSTPTFDIFGQASGPYPGYFEEKGSVTYNNDLPGAPGGEGPVLTFASTFTITESDGVTVSAVGTASLVPNGDLAVCFGGAGGGGVNIGPFLTHYTATITNPNGTSSQDSGSSYLTLSQSVGLGEYWSASLIQSFFATPPPPPPTLTLSNFTATVSGSAVRVSVETSPAIVNVTLEEGGAKVAPDTSPVNGVASWTLTDLAPGTHTLAVQGWDSPSGQPGHHSGVQKFVVTVPPPPSPPSPPSSPTPQPAPTPAPTPSQPISPPSSLGGSTPPTSSAPVASIRLLLPRKLGIAGLLRQGGYTWALRAPQGGRLVVTWYRARRVIALGHARFAKSGLVSVRIRLTAAGRRLLRTHRSLWLTAKATYTPTRGSTVAVTHLLRLLE